MNSFKNRAVFFLFFFTLTIWGQKKNTTAVRTSEKITMDGEFNEKVWDSVPIATDFVMFEPDNGKPQSKEQKSEVRVIYDDEAVYFAVMLYDDPSKILKEIALRDNFVTSDHFGVFINGFNDGQQDFRFFVSAAGTQMDCLAT